MTKVRQDAWSHEDDLLLAETVLRHVREGSTQLNAFEEVGDKLNRTSAACGFRWNAEVRKKYDDAMDLAKRQRKDRKRAMRKQASHIKEKKSISSPSNEFTEIVEYQNTEIEALTIDHVIQFLNEVKTDFHLNNQSKITLDQTKHENNLLRSHINELEKELKKTEKQLTTIQEDYHSFIQIMDRARKMTVLDDQGPLKAPTFRMDKNGNLEQLAEGYNS